MSLRRPLRTAVPAVALAVLLGACGGTGGVATVTTTSTVAAAGSTGATAVTQGPAGTPVTDAQASVLARLLLRDHDDGGAHVTGDFPFDAQHRVLVDGTVDWRNLRGTMSIREPDQPATAARRYFWTRDLVLAQQSIGSDTYTAARPNPAQNPADFLISALALLSSETFDNVAVIQDQGSRYLRRTVLDGRPIDVYQYGAGGMNEYWVDARSGELTRAVLNLPKLGGTSTLDFTQRGRKLITLPPASQRVAG